MHSQQNPIDNRPGSTGITPLGIVLMSTFSIIIIAILLGLSAPLVLRCRKKSDLTMALSNARQVGMALVHFSEDYGRFPDAETAHLVAGKTGSTLAPLGNSANAHLRQLIAADIVNTESVFYSKTSYTHPPDDVFDSSDTALAPGELGFGYILNGDSALGTSDFNPSIPVLVSPLAFDGKTVSATRFDPDVLDGRMILLRLDNSATSHTIDAATGDVVVNGKSWLATGSDTVWGEMTPRVATPVSK
jgi:hypothetical protein